MHGSCRREGRLGGLKHVTFELGLWGEVEFQQVCQRGWGSDTEKPEGIAWQVAFPGLSSER